jgi:outer membrane lipoprotein-sorting protein
MIPFSRLCLLLSLSLLASTAATKAQTAPNMEVVERWLGSNSGVNSLKIDFTQTRTMRSLKVPVRQQGTLWMDYGNDRFRWQTGDPAQTIVVSRGRNILIVRTPMKRYEVRPAGSGGAPGMAALANGFPRNLADFQRKYRVIEITPRSNTHRIVARPLGASGKGVTNFTFVVDASHYRLLGIEIDLEDGSGVDTVFSRVQTNEGMPSSLFKPDLTGYEETKF